MPMGIKEELRSPEYAPVNLAGGGSIPQPRDWTLRFLRASPQTSTDVPRLISLPASNFKSYILLCSCHQHPRTGPMVHQSKVILNRENWGPRKEGLSILYPQPQVLRGDNGRGALCPLTSSDPFYLTLVLHLPDKVDPTGFSLPT